MDFWRFIGLIEVEWTWLTRQWHSDEEWALDCDIFSFDRWWMSISPTSVDRQKCEWKWWWDPFWIWGLQSIDWRNSSSQSFQVWIFKSIDCILKELDIVTHAIIDLSGHMLEHYLNTVGWSTSANWRIDWIFIVLNCTQDVPESRMIGLSYNIQVSQSLQMTVVHRWISKAPLCCLPVSARLELRETAPRLECDFPVKSHSPRFSRVTSVVCSSVDQGALIYAYALSCETDESGISSAETSAKPK
jgi:hypothetical protein